MSLVNLTEALKDVCYEFDLPTPLLIDIQYRHFVKFNIVTLTQKDFIENVDFDKFIIENWI